MFEAIDSGRPTHHYKLTSTVILQLGAASEALGTLNLSGNLTRQVETDMTVKDDTTHVANVGRVSLLAWPRVPLTHKLIMINSLSRIWS